MAPRHSARKPCARGVGPTGSSARIAADASNRGRRPTPALCLPRLPHADLAHGRHDLRTHAAAANQMVPGHATADQRQELDLDLGTRPAVGRADGYGEPDAPQADVGDGGSRTWRPTRA
jgi:hypothetical protein